MIRRPRRVALALALLALGWGCAGRKAKVLPPPLPAPEALERGLAHLAQDELRKAREALQQIQFQGEPDAEIEPLARLALADATFYQRSQLGYIESRSLYLDFVTLYSDHPLAPYAQLQAGLASLRQVSHPTRDQTETLQAMTDLREVVNRWPETRWAVAAETLIDVAESNLAEHEFLVGKFYLNKEAWEAASQRFRRILERYPGYPDLEGVYFHLAQALRRANNETEARVYLDKLLTDYPDTEYAKAARRALDAVGGPLPDDGAIGGSAP